MANSTKPPPTPKLNESAALRKESRKRLRGAAKPRKNGNSVNAAKPREVGDASNIPQLSQPAETLHPGHTEIALQAVNSHLNLTPPLNCPNCRVAYSAANWPQRLYSVMVGVPDAWACNDCGHIWVFELQAEADADSTGTPQ